MIIKTEKFKECCSKILSSIDSNELSTLTETLELKTICKTLYLNVTNKEYYVSVKFDLDHEEEFIATVNAHLFLRLVNQLTVDFITLTCKDTYVEIKANGTYKIPLIFDDGKLFELPQIIIENKTVEMNIGSDVLNSILTYNSKELLKGTFAQPVQRLFYVDQTGCITFTSGACVNAFTLEKPIKMLLNNRLVKLFKLFKDSMVRFTLGYDSLSETIIQTKVSFETADIKLTSILTCDDSLLNSVPVETIRGRANKEHVNRVVLSKDLLMQAISRLLLFSAGYGSKENITPYSEFHFKKDGVSIYDSNKQNVETFTYENGSVLSEESVIILDLIDFKTTLDGCTEKLISLSFGDGKAVVLTRGRIRNVIPEIVNKVTNGGQ